MNGAPDITRGVADRGVGSGRQRERNIQKGGVEPIIPGRTFNVLGFDIGKADINKPGIKEQLEPIIQRLHLLASDGRHPVVRITGHASESRRQGKGPEIYAAQRAHALKAYLMERGVPEEWIKTDTSRSGQSGIHPAADAPPEGKAAARSATLEIETSPGGREIADKFGDVTYIKGTPRPTMPLKWPVWPLPLPTWGGLGALGALGMAALPVLGGVLQVVSLAEVLGVARSIFGEKKFPKSVAKYAGETIATGKSILHHIFPQQLLPQFNFEGINIHEYTKRIPTALHRLMHREWNELWRVFFELNGGTATPDQISQFARELMKRWGIEDLPVEVYRTDIPN